MRWGECTLRALPSTEIQPGSDAMTAEADAMEVDQEAERVELQGHVLLEQAGSRVRANQLTWDRRQQKLKAREPLFIERSNLKLVADEGEYFPEQGKGEMKAVEYRLHEPRARGTASRVELENRERGHFEQPTFTTCPPGNRGFLLRADDMEIDRKEQVGYFRGAKLRFLGVPIFYAPRLSIPLTDERRSGLLLPSVGYSSRNGFDLAVPYYFNLAANYDATLTPRILSRRGLLLGGEFRFLLPRNNGLLMAEILPNDRLHEGNDPRGAVHAKTRSHLAEGLRADLDINWISDAHYLEDLGHSLAVTSTRYLRNRAALSWARRDFDLIAEVLHYDTLDETIPGANRPYSLLPRVAFDWSPHFIPPRVQVDLSGELVHFHRKGTVRGERLDFQPTIALPLRNSWGYLEPALSARHTAYSLQNQESGRNSSPQRTTFTASLDSGLFFDRPVHWFGQALTHTLEPRAFYLYTPYRNQDDIPLFDTNLLDFTFDNLFRGNRYNGPDRVGDANQLTLALTSRVMRISDGRELLRASIGQIYYFEDLRVSLDPDRPVYDNSSSSVIAEVATELLRHWQLRAGLQVDPRDRGNSLRQGLLQATWRGERGRILHARWRKRVDAPLEQTDLAAIWPVSEQLNLIGRWYYSIEDSRTLEAVAGLEYGDCCWRLRTILRHYLDGPGDTYNDSVLLELELHGLGTLGNNIDKFLDRTIYGY